MTGRCSASTIVRHAASSPCRAANTMLLLSSGFTRSRARVREAAVIRADLRSVPWNLLRREGAGDSSETIGDQVGVVTGLAEAIVDELLVDDDLLARPFARVERQVLEALLENRHEPARTDVLGRLVGAVGQRGEPLEP